MATGNLSISAATSGGPTGANTFGPFTVTTSTAVPEVLQVALINGATTVTIPTGATWCVIVPPNATAPGTPTPNPSYAGTLTLKGVAGDTGNAISGRWWTVLTWDTAPASFVLASTIAATAEVIFG